MSTRPLYTIFFSLLLPLHFLSAQNDCEVPTLTNGIHLNGNNVRALYAASGSQLWDAEDSQFSVASEGVNLTTIFAQGLWLGAYDEAGNLKISAATYGASSGRSDFYPGPIGMGGQTSADACANFDRAWEVYRYQILAHQADFADNGVIDNPIPTIVGWPGSGNPEFETINGFALPENAEGYAPFQDLDQDGIYEPLAGEYPIEPLHAIIPEHLVFTVFNTTGNLSTNSNSSAPVPMEIHCLAWSLNCTENELLNNTIFTNYRFINRAVEPLDSLRVGLWNDFDLGCYTDDYVGSAPGLNTFFTYNGDNFDNDPCDQGIQGAGENPPVQAVTFLNQPLDAFIYANNPGFGPPIPTSDPAVAQEYFNYLSGRFRDGTPLTEGGNGYNPGSTEVVRFAFPGDPNDPTAWSQHSTNAPLADYRTLATIGIDHWEVGQILELDVAHSFHRVEGADYLGNVTAMYAGVAELQDLYDTNFASSCNPPIICDDDCIWAGDLNADGIANHEDAIALGFGLAATGNDRPAPYNWSPQGGNSWGNLQIFGTDNKHLDANGDGSVSLSDLDYTFYHYNFIRPDYEEVVEYPLGDELQIVRSGSNSELTGLSPGESFFAGVRLVVDIPDLRAIAFTLEYDPSFYLRFTFLGSTSTEEDYLILNRDIPGRIDYSYYETDTATSIAAGSLFPLSIRVRDDFPTNPPSQETQVRFRNLKGWLSDGTEVNLGAATANIQVDVVVNTDEPLWAQGLSIYPNPVQDRLIIQAEMTKIDEIQLLSSDGRRLLQMATNDHEIDVISLPSGIYYARIFSQGDFVVRKFVKQ